MQKYIYGCLIAVFVLDILNKLIYDLGKTNFEEDKETNINQNNNIKSSFKVYNKGDELNNSLETISNINNKDIISVNIQYW